MSGRRSVLWVSLLVSMAGNVLCNEYISQIPGGNNAVKDISLNSPDSTSPFLKSGNEIEAEFNIIKSWNFENEELGNYSKEEIIEDFSPVKIVYVAPVDIVEDEINGVSTKAMRITNLANDLWHGFSLTAPTGNDYNELYISYNWKFSEEFNSTHGGKLSGFEAFPVDPEMGPSPPRDGYGFICKVNFSEANKIYTYHYDRTPTSGDQYPWGTTEYKYDTVYLNNGTWYNITERIVMNTFTNHVANADGIFEVWVDGRMIFKETNLIQITRESDNIKANGFVISNFFGGTGYNYTPQSECYGYIDNISLYIPTSDPTVGTYNTHNPESILVTPGEITDRRVYYDKLITSIGTLRNSEYGSNYSSCIDEAYLVDAGAGNRVTYNFSYALGGADYLFFYDGNTSDAKLIRILRGNSSGNNQVVTSTGRYLFVRFSTDTEVSSSGWTGTLGFSNGQPEPQIPAAPSLLAVSSTTKSEVGLTWTDNSTNEQGFKIYRSLNSSTGFAETGSVAANTSAYTDTGLQPGTSYYYRIRAFNADGYSAYSATVSAVTLALQIPAAPTGLEATFVGYTNSVLAWTDQSENETGFQIERSGPDDFNIKEYFTTGFNVTSFTDSGLLMNSSYQYRVRAFNEDGNSTYTNIATAKTLYLEPPSAPSQLKSTDYTDKSITVKWSDNSTNESGFVISRTLATDPEALVLINVKANDTSFTDNDLTASTTYIYAVKAVNSSGASSLSNKDVASTLSYAETQRIQDGLVAYYNFTYDPDFIIRDLSLYGDPVNLRVLNPSAVAWKNNKNLDILSNTALVSLNPASKISSALKKTGEITLECWIKPAEPDASLNSRIISLGSDDAQVGVVLDQEYTISGDSKALQYSVRLQTLSTNASGYPEIVPDKSIQFISMQHVAYVRDSLGKEILYVDGDIVKEGFRPSGFDSWDDDFYLRIGNESDMNHPWRGTFYSTAIYNRALNFAEITRNFSVGPFDSLTHDGLEFKVEIHPNPLVNFATVSISPTEYQDYVPQATIRILDAYGKLYYQEILFNPNQQYFKTFDFTRYSRGVYFLQVLSGKNQKTTKLIIQ